MCIRYWTRVDDVLAGIVGGALVISMGLGGLWLWRSFHPMAHQYQLVSVAVDTPVRLGSEVGVNVMRRVLRDFPGRYVTTVRKVDAVEPVCSGGSEVPYKAQPEAPVEEWQPIIVTLDWWTAGAVPPCQGSLGTGSFVLTTCVYDETVGLVNRLWPRFVCVDSNLFEVTP